MSAAVADENGRIVRKFLCRGCVLDLALAWLPFCTDGDERREAA